MHTLLQENNANVPIDAQQETRKPVDLSLISLLECLLRLASHRFVQLRSYDLSLNPDIQVRKPLSGPGSDSAEFKVRECISLSQKAFSLDLRSGLTLAAWRVFFVAVFSFFPAADANYGVLGLALALTTKFTGLPTDGRARIVLRDLGYAGSEWVWQLRLTARKTQYSGTNFQVTSVDPPAVRMLQSMIADSMP
ncbi:hypothetical protein AA313_de0202133 [Arthrobotrys entomopaga]|nr:hypothetical protein AA313_de0202133 [Arthrobotrys entomopaga]